MGESQRDTPMSTLAVQIVQTAVKPDVSVNELAKLAQADAGFAMRLLSVVNSAAYALPNKVADMAHAAGLLGISGLKNLALSLSLSALVPMGKEGEILMANSLRRAVCARLIAQTLGVKKGVDDYFTTGLLLEAGLLARASDDLAGAAEIARCPASSRPVQERASGRAPHPERGAQMAVEWQLPEEISAAIAGHHDDKPPKERLGLVAWAAERIAGVFEGGDLEAVRTTAAKAAKHAGLKGKDFERILSELPGLVQDAASGFQRQIGAQVELEDLLRDANAQLVDLNRNYQLLVRKLERLLSEKEVLTDKLEKANERLAHIASTDGLTGLFNHRTFQDALRRDLHRAERADRPLSLVLLDVDHFKHFNDTYGHPAGDAVLRAIGKLLLASVRIGDVAARYGGEEFVLILPDTDVAGSTLLAERLRANIAKMRVKIAGKSITVTASMGVATTQGKCAKMNSELVSAADTALYAAKDAGRNCVRPGGLVGKLDE